MRGRRKESRNGEMEKEECEETGGGERRSGKKREEVRWRRDRRGEAWGMEWEARGREGGGREEVFPDMVFTMSSFRASSCARFPPNWLRCVGEAR